MPTAVLGTLSAALTSLAYPTIKSVKSVLSGSVLRIGDVEGRPEEAVEILVKTSKCTSLARAKGWKKFAKMPGDVDDDDDERKAAYAQLMMRTEYFIDRAEHDEDEDEDDKPKSKKDADEDAMDEDTKAEEIERVEKEQLIRGFKYGSTYVPCPDGHFPKLNSSKGIDICGFFYTKNVRSSPLPFFFHHNADVSYSSAETMPCPKCIISGQTQRPHNSKLHSPPSHKQWRAKRSWPSRGGSRAMVPTPKWVSSTLVFLITLTACFGCRCVRIIYLYGH